jgi:hypothetical protein
MTSVRQASKISGDGEGRRGPEKQARGQSLLVTQIKRFYNIPYETFFFVASDGINK